MKIKIITGLFLFLLLLNMGFCQASFLPEKSSMVLKGTSSLHDWESIVLVDQMQVELHIEEADPLLLGHLRLSIPVESIKSGKKVMDSKTYEALKSEEFSHIGYEVEVFDHNNGQVVASNGKLDVAGVQNIIPVTAVYNNTGSQELVTFRGSVSFKMTDFGIKPPTAMLGALKTGDELTIEYEITVEFNL